jgi:type IV pilus assembly protein PilC
MAALLDSGVPTLRALETLAGAVKGRERDDLLAMKAAIEEGDTFSEAAARRSKLFKDHALALIRAGEATGNLDGVLRELAEFAEQMHNFRNRILTKLAYPVLMLHAAAFIMGIVRLFDTGGDLAAALLYMVTVLGPVYLIVAAGAALFKMGDGSSSLRMFVDRIIYHCPGVGSVAHNLGMARFTGAFAALYEAGVPMNRALPLAANAAGTSVLRHRLAPSAEALAAGEPIARAMRESGLLNEIEQGMLFTGMEAGRVDEAFRRLEKAFGEAAGTTIDRLAIIIPGLIYGCVAIFVIIQILKLAARYVGMLNEI